MGDGRTSVCMAVPLGMNVIRQCVIALRYLPPCGASDEPPQQESSIFTGSQEAYSWNETRGISHIICMSTKDGRPISQAARPEPRPLERRLGLRKVQEGGA